MAGGTRQTNTFSEGLRKLLGELTDIKLADDADLPFLIQLETMILGKLKTGVDQALGQATQSPSDMGMGGPAGLMGSPSPAPGMGSPAGTPGLMQGPGPMNADELRRMLTHR